MSRLWERQHCGTARCCKFGRRTEIRVCQGWPRQLGVRRGIKRDVSDAGELRIGYFGWLRISMELIWHRKREILLLI